MLVGNQRQSLRVNVENSIENKTKIANQLLQEKKRHFYIWKFCNVIKMRTEFDNKLIHEIDCLSVVDKAVNRIALYNYVFQRLEKSILSLDLVGVLLMDECWALSR
ncbi:hypothetical protein NQ317_019062 [Molorchus minor]|uniref:Uncharacterized protein n=1 Tax=Molorchus minor TaxID=1323400 RepID=A0ABQ9JXS0_9CUCU|nr:hypothetical protein NQ317_019062 [Molorchus minor]